MELHSPYKEEGNVQEEEDSTFVDISKDNKEVRDRMLMEG